LGETPSDWFPAFINAYIPIPAIDPIQHLRQKLEEEEVWTELESLFK
jgi:hypothetical protein